MLCDKLYGGRSQLTIGEVRSICRNKDLKPEFEEERVLLDRQALHAHQIGFDHPETGEPLEFTSRLPTDMQETLDVLSDV